MCDRFGHRTQSGTPYIATCLKVSIFIRGKSLSMRGEQRKDYLHSISGASAKRKNPLAVNKSHEVFVFILAHDDL